MTGVVPNNLPALRLLDGISSKMHDMVGSVKSTISVFTPLLDGTPVATKYLITSSRKKTFWNGFVMVYETHADSEVCTICKEIWSVSANMKNAYHHFIGLANLKNGIYWCILVLADMKKSLLIIPWCALYVSKFLRDSTNLRTKLYDQSSLFTNYLSCTATPV